MRYKLRAVADLHSIALRIHSSARSLIREQGCSKPVSTEAGWLVRLASLPRRGSPPPFSRHHDSARWAC